MNDFSNDHFWSLYKTSSSVVAVTVMHVLLFVLHVCLLRQCDGVRLTAMMVWGMDEVW